jgi:hypothetical protein
MYPTSAKSNYILQVEPLGTVGVTHGGVIVTPRVSVSSEGTPDITFGGIGYKNNSMLVTTELPGSSAQIRNGVAVTNGRVHVRTDSPGSTSIRRGGLAFTDYRLHVSFSDWVLSQSPAAWFRFNLGITETGQGVSQWDDQSVNARHLKQGTDAARPAKQADGSILFNGTDEFLKCDAFTLDQPETVYFLGKQVTWTAGDSLFDGNAANMGKLAQTVTTPGVSINAGSQVAQNGDFVVDTYGVVSVVINGASSLIQVNNSTATTGNAGAGNMGGFALGARGDSTNFSNIQVKEAILFPSAHDAATRKKIINYLALVGQLSI